MKNLLLLILIAFIPFMSIAQKRSKKVSNAKMPKVQKFSPSEYEYMIIQGIQQSKLEGLGDQEIEQINNSPDVKMKYMLKGKNKHIVRFDTGLITAEQKELNRIARECNHMSDALYQASKRGWSFISASHTILDGITTHYYYMQRKRNIK